MNEQLAKAMLKLARLNLVSTQEVNEILALKDEAIAEKIEEIRRTRIENTLDKMLITTFLNRYNLETMKNDEEEEKK